MNVGVPVPVPLLDAVAVLEPVACDEVVGEPVLEAEEVAVPLSLADALADPDALALLEGLGVPVDLPVLVEVGLAVPEVEPVAV